MYFKNILYIIFLGTFYTAIDCSETLHLASPTPSSEKSTISDDESTEKETSLSPTSPSSTPLSTLESFTDEIASPMTAHGGAGATSPLSGFVSPLISEEAYGSADAASSMPRSVSSLSAAAKEFVPAAKAALRTPDFSTPEGIRNFNKAMKKSLFPSERRYTSFEEELADLQKFFDTHAKAHLSPSIKSVTPHPFHISFKISHLFIPELRLLPNRTVSLYGFHHDYFDLVYFLHVFEYKDSAQDHEYYDAKIKLTPTKFVTYKTFFPSVLTRREVLEVVLHALSNATLQSASVTPKQTLFEFIGKTKENIKIKIIIAVNAITHKSTILSIYPDFKS
jgi:hypothetical protein